MKILLASASPRRHQILSEAGYDVTVVSPRFDESAIAEQAPCALVAALAEGKGRSIAPQPDRLIVAADTVVVFQGKILGKPRDAREAAETLAALSGQTHEVFTGVWLRMGSVTRAFAERTEVQFRALSIEEIEAYIASGSPFDKAGSYGIQDSGFVAEIRGSYHNVVGFPLERFEEIIKTIKEEKGIKNGKPQKF